MPDHCRAFTISSFQHPLRALAAHKRSIYSEMNPETIQMLSRFPCIHTQTHTHTHTLESSRASSRGMWVRGERLNNALIQLVGLHPLLNAPAQTEEGWRTQKIPPK